MSTISFHIEVPLRQRWHNIELLRTSVLNCLATLFQDQDYCHAVSMVATELLENAVKYGDWSRDDIRAFRLYVEGDNDRVTVEVTNPVVRGSAEVKSVVETLATIEAAPSAADAYRKRLFKLGSGNASEDTSRLGLLRIAYEGNCEISAHIDGRDVLSVRARVTARSEAPEVRHAG